MDVAAPFGGPDQAGSGLGAVRTDNGLRVFDNLFALGGRLPTGTGNCQLSDCRRLRGVNTMTGASDPFANAAVGNLALRRGWRGVPVPGYWRG